MKISFDLDGTLICYDPVVPRDKHPVPWILRLWFREPLRRGAVDLLRRLQSLGHEVVIYTTSHRSPISVRWWLRCYGIRIGQVINQHMHEREVSRLSLPRSPTKFPSLFHIDLHVDDLPGVAVEGEEHGFDVLVIDPHDEDWTSRVLETVADRTSVSEEAGLDEITRSKLPA